MDDWIGADAAHYAMLGLRQRLAGGKVLVLMDGLDEVPEKDGRIDAEGRRDDLRRSSEEMQCLWKGEPAEPA